MTSINKIIGREVELDIFNTLLKSKNAEFVAVYGRRRVGKTFLIREAFKKQIIFEFTGSFETDMHIQLKNFYENYKNYSKQKLNASEAPKNWFEAFALLSNLSKLKNKKKSVIFIDELPWIDTPKSNFVNALAYFWNNDISKLNNIILVICGSATSWITKKIFKNTGGLHNRVTKRLKIEPFTLAETKKMCRAKNISLTNYQLIKIYMAFGGIPFYWNELKKGKSAIQQINDICFNPEGMLKTEYKNLYQSLFKNADNHIKIIECLAKKTYGLSKEEIAKACKIKKGGSLTTIINELVENGFLSYHQPIFNVKKNAVYRLIDLYSLFYLKFIKTAKANTNFDTISNKNAYKIWCGYAFENVCILHINQIKKALGISGVACEISSWRKNADQNEKGTQIDLIIDRADNIINICEIKFYNKKLKIDKKMYHNIQTKKWVFENNMKSNKAVHNVLISTYGAEKNNYFLEQIDNEIIMKDLFLE